MPRLTFAAVLSTFFALIPLSGLPAFACGPDSDCMLGDRPYRIQMPQGVSNPGAIIFAHGYRGSHLGTMRNKNLRAVADRLGVAFVAVKSYAEDWRIPGTPSDMGTDGAVELLYFDQLVADLGSRHGIDTSRLMLTGFSAGGMLVWQMACDRGDSFAAFVPIAGTFWGEIPQTCATAPANLIHIHGTGDRIVPLEGRPIGQTHQGSVTGALALARRLGGFTTPQPVPAPDLDCTAETAADGALLEVCLHPGGHSVKSAWIERAWQRFEQTGAL
ncbi:MAG: polyhydroxybutyrate depolymerase [Pseudomonadota bacterium]